MAYRELTVIQIREVLRLWQQQHGYRTIAARVGVDRKTVRRYVEAARTHGLSRVESSVPLDDDLLAAVVGDVLPGAPSRVGAKRAHCRSHRDLIQSWLDEGCDGPKVARLLDARTGTSVPLRTLRRFIADDLGVSSADRDTMRVVDPPPGQVFEIDFMEVGTFKFAEGERKLHALVGVAGRSRYMFVWPCLSQTRRDVIDGLEASWSFLGGVFPVVVFDNAKTVVLTADPVDPVLAEDAIEYSQARKFEFDPTRSRKPKDKARVERMVRYIRRDCFAAEHFVDVDQARRHAKHWCREIAGKRRHGTTRKRPLEAFEAEELPLLLPAPTERYDPPSWHTVTVGRDHAISVAEGLYSVPYTYRGEVRVRVDRTTVRIYARKALIKVHERAARGESRIDADDLPPGKGVFATRDAEGICAIAARRGEHVGRYAERVLEGPHSWTRIRQVYRLLNLCKRHGEAQVDEACRTALDHDVVEVKRIERMLKRAVDDGGAVADERARSGVVVKPRFGRDADAYRLSTPD